ncbi:PE family protein [Mycolicibacterium obuense]|uniref:PE family protein n=1 Tax=Mycolicibacterium obuense TaxID=1807 RepID=A0A0M2JVN3_9MYCO|nr:PE family protein [Mycolicibacterium obuense]KKE98678.1 PE family protein [Mycolicibacterium obuense]
MFLTADPLEMGGTAGSLTALTSAFTSGNAAAAAPTTAVAPGQANETAMLLSAAFGTHGSLYQSMAAMASAWHGMFASAMGTSGASYAATEAFNVAATL